MLCGIILVIMPFHHEKGRLSDLLKLMMLAGSKVRAGTQDSPLEHALSSLSSMAMWAMLTRS